MMRFMVSMEEDFVERLDAYAAAHGQSRSAVIRLAAQEYLDAQAKLPALKAYLSGVMIQTGAALSGDITKQEYAAKLDEAGEQMQLLLKR